MNRIVAKTDNIVQAQINVLCQFVTEGVPVFRPKDFDARILELRSPKNVNAPVIFRHRQIDIGMSARPAHSLL